MAEGNHQAVQAEAERAVFREFAKKANLPIDLRSIESREPPEPDILCRGNDGEFIAFELVSLSDPDVAEQVCKREQDPTSAMFVGGANFEAVLRKFENSYKTDAPIELICHVGEFLLTPEEFVLQDLEMVIKKVRAVRFRRVWFMGETISVVSKSRVAPKNPVAR